MASGEQEPVVVDIAQGTVLIFEDFVWSFLDYGIFGAILLSAIVLVGIYFWRRPKK